VVQIAADTNCRPVCVSGGVLLQLHSLPSLQPQTHWLLHRQVLAGTFKSFEGFCTTHTEGFTAVFTEATTQASPALAVDASNNKQIR